MTSKGIFEYLPLEILKVIVKSLDIQSICKISQTNKFWRKYFLDDFVWEERCKNDFNSTGFPDEDSTWFEYYKSLCTFRVCVICIDNPQSPRLSDVIEKLIQNGLNSVQIQSFYLNSTSNFEEIENAVKRSNSVFFWERYERHNLGEFIGDLLSDFVDGGGGVLLALNGSPTGKWISTDKFPLMNSYYRFSEQTSDGINFDFPHPILQGVAKFRGGSGFAAEPILSSGIRKIAFSMNGYPLVMIKYDLKIAYLNFYPPSSDVRKDFWDSSTDGGKLMVNALRFVSGKYKKPLFIADSEVLS